MTASVTIVEDDSSTRARFSALVNDSTDFSLLASCATLKEGIVALQTAPPDILLVDLGLPDGSGLELINYVEDEGLSTKAIVVTVFEDNRNIMRAIHAGARGYILKDDESLRVRDAIKMILNGGAPISPTIARHILESFNNGAVEPQADPEIESLTRREVEVLQQVSQGFTDKEIAARESISYHTVTTHVKHIYKKLRVKSRVEATRKAVAAGLIE